MYHAYQTQNDLMWPLRTLAKASVPMLTDTTLGLSGTTTQRRLAAACEVLSLAEVTHKRPPWGIPSVKVHGTEIPVVEEAAHVTPFACCAFARTCRPCPKRSPNRAC